MLYKKCFQNSLPGFEIVVLKVAPMYLWKYAS